MKTTSLIIVLVVLVVVGFIIAGYEYMQAYTTGAENASLKSNLSADSKTIQSLQSQLQELQGQVSQLNTTNSANVAKIKALEANMTALEQRLEAALSGYTQANATISTLKQELKAATTPTTTTLLANKLVIPKATTNVNAFCAQYGCPPFYESSVTFNTVQLSNPGYLTLSIQSINISSSQTIAVQVSWITDNVNETIFLTVGHYGEIPVPGTVLIPVQPGSSVYFTFINYDNTTAVQLQYTLQYTYWATQS